MQTYPPDIMAAAELALDKLLCNCAESCGGQAGVRAASILDIAAAIATERERCAAKALEYASHYSPGSDGRNTLVMLADWIEN